MNQQKTQQAANQHAARQGAKAGRRTAQPASPQQMVEAPESLRPEDVLAAQQQFGNQVVQRALADTAEREPLTDEQGHLHPSITGAIQQRRGGGTPLPREVETEMRQKLGRGFQDVRIHTDSQADSLSRAINARAFTIGSDIFFKSGAFAPGTSRGRDTLIHELTHVVQQSGARAASGKLKLGARGNAMEQQAEQTAARLAPTGPAPQAAAAAVQRQAEEEELQMQAAEEEELQMQAEEEELQMQAEEEEIQMQAEEEEIQMQPEEEEIQMVDDDEPKKKLAPDETSRWKSSALGGWKRNVVKKAAPEVKPKKYRAPASRDQIAHQTTRDAGAFFESRAQGGKGKDPLAELLTKKRDEIMNKKKSASTTTDSPGPQSSEQAPSTGPAAKAPESIKKSEITGLSQSVGKAKQQSNREHLLKVIRDPKSKTEDVQSAEEQLRALHKKKIGFNVATSALDERKKALKEAARQGDTDAFEQLKKEKSLGMMPSKWQRFKKFASSAASGVGSVLSTIGGGISKAKEALSGAPLVGKQFKEGMAQFTGKAGEKEDKEEEKEKGSSVNVNISGGGGGSGVSAMMDKFMEVVQENQRLKQELEKLKSASSSQ